MNKTLRARYLIETSFELEQAAEILAGEQSSGAFVKIPGETDQLREGSGAEIVSIEETGTVNGPSLPGAKQITGKPIKQAQVEICWPFDNMGANLPNLCAMAYRLLQERYLDADGVQDVFYEYQVSVQAVIAKLKGQTVESTIVDPGFVIHQDNKEEMAEKMWGSRL